MDPEGILVQRNPIALHDGMCPLAKRRSSHGVMPGTLRDGPFSLAAHGAPGSVAAEAERDPECQLAKQSDDAPKLHLHDAMQWRTIERDS
jgi:hypothetical protein